MKLSQPSEGVIKFVAEHRRGALGGDAERRTASELVCWRLIFERTRLLGRDPARYDGAAWGNVSGRLPPFPGDRGRRRFLVTGTQTSGQRILSEGDFCIVEAYDATHNRVKSFGPVWPSSESLTHGAVYDLNPAVRFVVHAHSEPIWRHAQALRLPRTAPDVEYGSARMAREVQRVCRTMSLATSGLFVMGGHRDGVVAFGKTAGQASTTLLETLAQAHALDYATHQTLTV